MRNLRKILFAVAAFGAAVTAAGAGTFASFSASTTNGDSSFETGSLVLSNQKGSATACLSTGGASTDSNANGSCDALFAATVQKPGDSAFVDLTIANAGSIAGTALTAYRAGACSTSSVGSHSGTGDLCSALQLYVQEYTSAANRTANTTAGGTCLYGGGTATACAFDATKTVGGFPASGSPVTMGAMSAGATRYLRVYLQLPSSADNTVQGRRAAFGLTWALVQ